MKEVNGKLFREPIDRSSRVQFYLALAHSYSQMSTCVRRAAGCVGVDKYNVLVGAGYNGVPRGWAHCLDMPCEGANEPAGSTDLCQSTHAEINCIINARGGADAIETIYLTCTPCKTCALALANLPNLRKVVAASRYADFRGVHILEKSGIIVMIDPELTHAREELL